MDWDDAFPILLLALVAAAVFAAKMRGQVRALRLQYAGLTEKFSTLDERVARMAEQLAAFREGQPPPADLATSAPVSPPATEAVPARQPKSRFRRLWPRRRLPTGRRCRLQPPVIGNGCWSRTGWYGWAVRRWRSAAPFWSSCRSTMGC